MVTLVVGIDTSKDKGKRLVGVVVGTPQNMNKFISVVDLTAREHGFNGNLHWKSIKTKQLRDKLLLEHSGSLKKYGLYAHIFPTLRFDKDKRTYYLKKCPWVIGSKLVEFIDERTDKMAIVLDSDFDSLAPMPKQDSRRPTLVFLDRLVSKISTELAMTPLSAKGKNNGVYQVIERNHGKNILIEGLFGSQNNPEIQAADMVLGMYKWAKTKNKAIDRVVLEKEV